MVKALLSINFASLLLPFGLVSHFYHSSANFNYPYDQVHTLANSANQITEVQTVFQRLNGFPDFQIFQEELDFPIQSFAQLNIFN